MQRNLPGGHRSNQRGAVLVVSLILLLMLTVIGVTAARLQTGQEAMARNETNHQLAMQSAEAALRSAETILWEGIYSTADFAGNSNGLYELKTEVLAPGSSIADTVNWSSPGTSTQVYSGPALSADPTPTQQAQVIIENLPPVSIPGNPICSAGYGADQACSVFRVTAHATGGDSSANATLQSIFH